MFIAPAAALLGIMPYLFVLNLTFIQSLRVIVVALIVCYVAGVLVGAPGYLVLRSLGYLQAKYLITYAAFLVVVAALLFSDGYVLLSLGPPMLLAAAAFCFLRGTAIQRHEAS
jgi:hypothetical protein